MTDSKSLEVISKVYKCMRAMHLGITMFPFNWALNVQVADVHYWMQIGPFAIDFGWDPVDENL